MTRLRTLRLLLHDLRLLWMALGVLLVAAAVCLAFPTPGTVRAVGVLLQLLGLTLVTAEVIRTWRRARTPSPRDWLRRLASAIRPPKTTAPAAAADRGPGKPVAPASFAKVPAGAGLEQRVRTLEKNIEELRRELTRAFRAQDRAVADVRQMLERDVQAREGAIGHAERALGGAAAEGVPLELVGLAWLWAGVLCATAAGPIASTLAWIGR